MVWFILASILLYIVLFFSARGSEEDFDMNKFAIYKSFKVSGIILGGIIAVCLLVLFIVLGIITCFPVIDR